MHVVVKATKPMANAYMLPSGEEARFNELMSQTYRKVYNLAYRLSGNRNDAEDLTQEAFYRAYRSFAEFEGDRPFENWIFRIVTRLFLDLIRSRRRRIQAVSFDAPLRSEYADDSVHLDIADATPGPEQRLMETEMSEVVEAALARLKPEQRVLVMLADVQGMPYQEIADAVGVPVGTVRSRLHRAHKQLRAFLEAARPADASGALTVCPDV